jgi:hypothetical protein
MDSRSGTRKRTYRKPEHPFPRNDFLPAMSCEGSIRTRMLNARSSVFALAPILLLMSCARSSAPEAPAATAKVSPAPETEQQAPAAAAPPPAAPAAPAERPREAQEPTKAADSQPGDLAAEIRAFEVAEKDLKRALEKTAAVEVSRKKGVAKNPPPGTPRPASGELDSSDTCSMVCSALASMERSASHVCDLVGESDHRCANARTRVHTATARVRASCPKC